MKQIEIASAKLNVFDEGEGPVILFVHGFPLDHSMWRKQLEFLVTSHRVIAPDLRGFGGSSRISSDPISMETLADDLHQLLEKLDVVEPIVFCGLSMGGYVGWQFLFKYRSRLRGLIQCDTRAIADDEAGAANRKKLAELVLEKGTQPIAAAMLPNLFSRQMSNAAQALMEETKRVVEATDPRTVAAAALGLAIRPDITDQLGDIDVPTLLLVGADDRISPPDEMRGISQAIPGSQFVVVPDSGHMAPLENPDFCNNAIQEFVDSLDK